MRHLAGRFVVPLLVGACALAVGGCSREVETGPPVVARADLEQEISTRLGEQVGRQPEEVSCPGDLTGTVDEQMRCTVTDSGTDAAVTVTVTSVAGDDVRFDLRADGATP